MKKLGLLLLCAMAACKPAESSYEVVGTPTERIAKVTKIIKKHSPLPSPLRDAHFIEEQSGNGVLGPSDFAAFYALTVAPSEIAAWRSALTPIQPPNTSPQYAAPKRLTEWWITKADFLGLEFYSPKSLTDRYHGWIGISPKSGKIFIYSFTM